MIAKINESKALIKYTSWECKCKFDETKPKIQIIDGITINLDVSVKSIIYVKKIISAFTFENIHKSQDYRERRRAFL